MIGIGGFQERAGYDPVSGGYLGNMEDWQRQNQAAGYNARYDPTTGNSFMGADTPQQDAAYMAARSQNPVLAARAAQIPGYAQQLQQAGMQMPMQQNLGFGGGMQGGGMQGGGMQGYGQGQGQPGGNQQFQQPNVGQSQQGSMLNLIRQLGLGMGSGGFQPNFNFNMPQYQGRSSGMAGGGQPNQYQQRLMGLLGLQQMPQQRQPQVGLPFIPE